MENITLTLDELNKMPKNAIALLYIQMSESFTILSAQSQKIQDQNERLIHQIEDTDYVYENDLKQQVDKLQTEQELRIWLVNYLNDMKRYMQLHYQFEFPDEMKTAVDYLNDNYYKPDLALGEVASHAGFSEKYFSTLFTRKMGSSFSSYLKKLRIHHAKVLLQGTQQKMKEISQSVGYNSVEYFVRVFSAEMGMSPSAYRKEHRASLETDEQ